MRINYIEEDRPGLCALWQANCDRSIHGKVGQRELRELEAALLALPEKRLIHRSLVDDKGGVCAIACYARHKGVDLSKFDPKDESDEVGIAAGMPRLVAWKVVALNDIELEDHYERLEGPNRKPVHDSYYQSGVWTRVEYTPEERYEQVLVWVRRQLEPVAAQDGTP